MNAKSFQQTCLTIGVVALCQFAEAQAATPPGVGSIVPALTNHPILSAIVHIVFLSALLGVGSTIVAVLFKSPYRE